MGTGFKPPLKGLALAALEWLQVEPCAGAGRRSAFGLGGGRDGGDRDGAGLSRRCGDHLYRAQAGACLRAIDPALGPAGGGGADRLAGGGDLSPTLGVHWAGSALALAQAPRAAAANKGNFGHVLVVGGRIRTAGGKSGAPAMAALAALRSGGGAGDGGGSRGGAGAGGRRCAGADDAGRWRLDLRAASAPDCLTPEALAGADGGQDGAGHWAGNGAGGGDGEVRRPACWRRHEDSGGDRCRCAEYSGGQAGAAGQAGQGADGGADAASGRDGAAGRDSQWPRCRPTGWRWRAGLPSGLA